MKKTREKILDTAQRLFNEYGVSDVSIRKIASDMGISHTNLIYHFKTKNDILDHLHLRILHAAKAENEKLHKEEDMILALLHTTRSGFRILYDFRFFMIDLNYIMRLNEPLHHMFLEVEKLRATMYRDLIHELIAAKLMRKEEYQSEYEQLITRIRIFSDYWISSSDIYDGADASQKIEAHSQLLMSMFYPYLSRAAKESYRKHLQLI